jgi:sulfotransferase family protein
MMSKEKFPHKILWLASYPKSGNTWFRAFLSALMNEGEVQINRLKTDGIFSLRDTFDSYSDLISRDLYNSEAKSMIADVYRNLASEKNSLSIVKVHDAFDYDDEGLAIIPEDVTHCAIYFIRNPLDIAGSLANHMHFSLDAAIKMLNSSKACMAPQPNNLNTNPQFVQPLHDWSTHVNSWTLRPSFPVLVVRYEDMLSKSFLTFENTLKFIGWQYPPEEIYRAIAASSFESLSKQETEGGFSEKFNKSPKFFRAGKMGNWQKELSNAQADEIVSAHKKVMKRYGYLSTK